MKREEVLAVLGMMKIAYPRFYQTQSRDEIKQAADLWSEMFKDMQTADVVRAVRELIKELEFPPTIADVTKKVKVYEWERRIAEEVVAQARAKEEYSKLLEGLKNRQLGAPKSMGKDDKIRYISECRKAMKGEPNDKI